MKKPKEYTSLKRKNREHKIEKIKLVKKSWAPPHIDAEIYINGVINTLEENVLLWHEVGDIESEDIIDDLIPRSRTIGSYLFDESLDQEYEAHAEIDDDNAFLKDTINAAKEALEARKIEDLLDAIEAIIDGFHFKASYNLSEITKIDNWINVLNQTSSDKDTRESERQDVFFAVALVVRTLAEKLCELVAKEPLALQQIEWRHLEYVIATALEKIGFQIELTPPSKDGGKDVVATCKVQGQKYVFYVEIKHWRSGKRVGSKMIFDFLEVNVLEQTAGGLFISSSGFMQTIYSQIAEISRQCIRLGDSDKIVSLCQHFVRKQKGIWKPIKTLPEILFEKTA